jgi:hypothetical protein
MQVSLGSEAARPYSWVIQLETSCLIFIDLSFPARLTRSHANAAAQFPETCRRPPFFTHRRRPE